MNIFEEKNEYFKIKINNRLMFDWIILYDWDRCLVGVTVGVNPRFVLRLSIKSSIRDNGRRVFTVESSGISWVLLSNDKRKFLNENKFFRKLNQEKFKSNVGLY